MTIYVLFGEMAVVKNYIGERLAKHLDCEFFDGDLVIPPKMSLKIANFKPLTHENIHNYVHMHLIPAIEDRVMPGKNLVVAQALYRQEHREAIIERLHAHDVRTVYLPVLNRKKHLKRLYTRTNGWKWALYGVFNSIFFEEPLSDTLRLRSEESYNSDLEFQFELLERGF